MRDDFPKITDLKTLKKLPFLFHHLEVRRRETNQINTKSKFISIDFYQTDMIQPYPHYKLISKIIIPIENE